MLPMSLRIVNIGPYKDETIDFDSIPDGLVALCGRNGEGKTMLMETIFAGAYRFFPSRPAGIYKYCTDRRAWIELRFRSRGKVYTSIISLDSQYNKMEPVLVHDAVPMNEDGLSGTFDAEIEKLLGSQDQVLASAYGAQEKTGNFIRLAKAKRKDLFIKMIGLSHLQDIAEMAKKRAEGEPAKEKARIEGQIQTLSEMAERDIPDLKEIEESCAALEKGIKDREARQKELIGIVASLGTKADQHSKVSKEIEDVKAQIASISSEIVSLGVDLAEQTRRAGEIPELRARRDSLTENMSNLKVKAMSLKENSAKESDLVRRKDELIIKLVGLNKDQVAAKDSLTEAINLSGNIEELRSGAEELKRLQKDYQRVSTDIENLRGELETISIEENKYLEQMSELKLKVQALESAKKNADMRLDSAHKSTLSLKTVPCKGEGEFADCKFIIDAAEEAKHLEEYVQNADNAQASILATMKDMENLPRPEMDRKKKTTDRIAGMQIQISEIKSAISALQTAAERLQDAELAAGRVTILQSQIESIGARIADSEASLSDINSELKEIHGAGARLEEITKQIEPLNADLFVVSDKLSLYESAPELLKGLEARIGSKEKDLQDVNSRLKALSGELSGIQEAAEKKKQHDLELDDISDVISAKKDRLATDKKTLASLQEQVKSIKEAKDKLKPAKDAFFKVSYDIACLTRLAKTFGPMEIQSFEIDCAGPEVSKLANDLLFNCFGPRFSIKLITQELKADGKGFKDEFDISVHDSKNGEWRSIDDLSGGEKTIVSEAVALAIALYNKQKNDIAWDSLFRDEVTGALDDVHAPKYIAMLKAAREMGAFSKVYFISHEDRVKDLADARIEVSGGKISIVA